jgi:hypothetical protein
LVDEKVKEYVMVDPEAQPGARRSRTRRSVTSVAIVLCVGVGAVSVVIWANHGDASATKARQAAPKRAAERLAAQLRDSAVLPSGAKPTTAAPPNILSAPLESLSSPNLVDVHGLWIVAEPSEQVVGFLRTHAPHGMANGACCATAGGPDGRAEMVQFVEPANGLPSSDITEAQIQVSVTSSWVRVDAQAVWRARRDPAERVPATDHIVTITLDTSNDRPRPIVVSDRNAVNRLESSFNHLFVAVPAVSNGCGFEPTYTVRFSTTRTARPDVVATLFCGGARVTVGGHASATLDASAFTSQIAAVIPSHS